MFLYPNLGSNTIETWSAWFLCNIYMCVCKLQHFTEQPKARASLYQPLRSSTNVIFDVIEPIANNNCVFHLITLSCYKK